MKLLIQFLLALSLACKVSCFVAPFHTKGVSSTSPQSTPSSLVGSSTVTLKAAASLAAEGSMVDKTQESVNKLKKVLEREYVSFFNPMERSYYAKDVSFDDPMTSLEGIDAYQNNVDMLSSRTFLGKILFSDAGIALHSVTGGDVANDGSISNIVTRWTLRVTAKILPWKPTARFSGVSVYEVAAGGPEGVQVVHQTDYWDSINLAQGGSYAKVDTGIAVKDFLDQLKPENGQAVAAGPEIPYELLRRGKDYDIRRYPSYSVARIPYDRRDEGYDVIASLTKGSEPFAPSIMNVPNDDTQKTMSWPLTFAAPGQVSPPSPKKVVLDRVKEPLWRGCKVETIPSQVVAVGRFSDASVPPVVRKADRLLRGALQRDGIDVPASSDQSVTFAQYDAIFSMGTRRGEVWIALEDGGHPW